MLVQLYIDYFYFCNFVAIFAIIALLMSDLYLSLLKKYHLSNTKVRNTIFTILKEQDRPLQLSSLSTLAKVHRSSIYRTVDAFEKAGIVKKLYTGWKESVELSEVFHRHHHHMTCTQCGKTISFEETSALEDELTLAASYHDFHPDNHSIEFSGLCADCYSL